MIADTSSFKQYVKNNTLLSGRKHIYKQNVRTTIHKLDPIAADGRNAIILSWTISSKLYHITTAESQTYYFSWPFHSVGQSTSVLCVVGWQNSYTCRYIYVAI